MKASVRACLTMVLSLQRLIASQEPGSSLSQAIKDPKPARLIDSPATVLKKGWASILRSYESRDHRRRASVPLSCGRGCGGLGRRGAGGASGHRSDQGAGGAALHHVSRRHGGRCHQSGTASTGRRHPRLGSSLRRSLSAYYLAVNRNKRSLTLDLKSEEGRDVLRRLIVGADVVIDNFKLGTMESWGFDDEWFEAHAPQAVRCSITGYGATGPKASKPGYDFILQAESGLMAITGEAEGSPMKLGVAIVDVCAGLTAAIAVLGALQARARTGLGQHCEVSLHDVGLQMLINVASNHLVSGEEAGRFGNSHPNIVPYRTYRAADGEVAVAVGNDRQFAALAEVLGRPEWARDPRFSRNQDRVRNRETIDSEIGAVIASETMLATTVAPLPIGVAMIPSTTPIAITITSATTRVPNTDHASPRTSRQLRPKA